MKIKAALIIAKVFVKQYAPEILIGISALATVGGVATAISATTKVDKVIDDHTNKMAEIASTRENRPEEYSEKDVKRDTLITYGQTAGAFVKLYWPTATLLALSGVCVLSAHGIMQQRNVAVVAAYKALEGTYSGYRARVRDKIGTEEEAKLHQGITQKSEMIADAKGKLKERKVDTLSPDMRIYQFTFGPNTSRYWKRGQHAVNLMFLKTAQNYLNDLMWSRETDKTYGYVTLNEMLGYLGMDDDKVDYGLRTGCSTAAGDTRVDFDVFDMATGEPKGLLGNRDIMDMSIPINFNCVGLLDDLIKRNPK